MRPIQLTRKAIKDLRKLQSVAHKAPERLFKPLAVTEDAEKFVHTIRLRGYTDRWRSRIDLGGGSSLRFVWIENKADRSIRFLYVDQRDDDTYEGLDQLPQEPAYLWNGELDAEWRFFLNSGYQKSLVLTEAQRLAIAPIDSSYIHHSAHHKDSARTGFFAQITQGPAGSGKTVVASKGASERYAADWRVIFLLPQHLLKEVKALPWMQSIPIDDPRQGFFYGTFSDWIAFACPKIAQKSLSPDEELRILKKIAVGAERSKQQLNLQDLGLRDLILYEAFVLRDGSEQHKNAVYKDNRRRIEALKHIKPEWWHEEFSKLDKRSRADIAEQLREKWEDKSTTFEIDNFQSENKNGSIFIIDEAQDYLLSEIEAIKSLCRHIHQDSHLMTHLWLLGDLNQRITPVDFSWRALQLGKPNQLPEKSLRNSGRILAFSNLLLSPVAEASRDYDSRHQQKPADPNNADEVGEPVKLLVYPGQLETEDFLKQLSQSIGINHKTISKDRSLIHTLASRVKILTDEAFESQFGSELDFLNVHEVKGQGFDTCIVFNIFKHTGKRPVSENWWQWYTLLTRTRSRLLVIVTHEQHALLKTHIPAILSACEQIDSQCPDAIESLCQWIQAENNDVDFSIDQKTIVKRCLIDSLQAHPPIIYDDTYEILDQIELVGEERTALEETMMQKIRDYSADTIKAELDRLKKLPKAHLLTSLILRATDQYWEGTQAINALKKGSQSKEYIRVVEAVAENLENDGLLVEAARVRHRRLGTPYPEAFPFPEVAKTEENLISVLTNILRCNFQIK